MTVKDSYQGTNSLNSSVTAHESNTPGKDGDTLAACCDDFYRKHACYQDHGDVTADCHWTLGSGHMIHREG